MSGRAWPRSTSIHSPPRFGGRPARPCAAVEGQGGVLRVGRGAHSPAGRRDRPDAGVGRHEVVEHDVVADVASLGHAADARQLAGEDLRIRSFQPAMRHQRHGVGRLHPVHRPQRAVVAEAQVVRAHDAPRRLEADHLADAAVGVAGGHAERRHPRDDGVDGADRLARTRTHERHVREQVEGHQRARQCQRRYLAHPSAPGHARQEGAVTRSGRGPRR